MSHSSPPMPSVPCSDSAVRGEPDIRSVAERENDLPVHVVVSDAPSLPKIDDDGVPMDFSILSSNEVSPTSESIQSGLRSIYELADEGSSRMQSAAPIGDKLCFSLSDDDDGGSSFSVISIARGNKVAPKRIPHTHKQPATRHVRTRSNSRHIRQAVGVPPSVVIPHPPDNGTRELPLVANRCAQPDAPLPTNRSAVEQCTFEKVWASY